MIVQERILITGATGFVGSWMVQELRRSCPDAILFGTAHSLPLREVEGVSVLICDITDQESVNRVLRMARPTRVIHLAGIASAVSGDTERIKRINSDSITLLLRGLTLIGGWCRVLIASSGYVYGVTEPGRPAVESDELHPMGAYAESKVDMENQVNRFFIENPRTNLFVVFARAFNHTGPKQTDAFVVPAFAKQIARIERGADVPIVNVGNLDAERDFLHVQDVALAYRKLVYDAEICTPVTVVNVASGVGVSIRHILEELVTQASVSVDIVTDPARLRPSDLPQCIGSPARLKSITDWEQTISLRDTLADTLNYWRNQNP